MEVTTRATPENIATPGDALEPERASDTLKAIRRLEAKIEQLTALVTEAQREREAMKNILYRLMKEATTLIFGDREQSRHKRRH